MSVAVGGGSPSQRETWTCIGMLWFSQGTWATQSVEIIWHQLFLFAVSFSVGLWENSFFSLI